MQKDFRQLLKKKRMQWGEVFIDYLRIKHLYTTEKKQNGWSKFKQYLRRSRVFCLEYAGDQSPETFHRVGLELQFNHWSKIQILFEDKSYFLFGKCLSPKCFLKLFNESVASSDLPIGEKNVTIYRASKN